MRNTSIKHLLSLCFFLVCGLSYSQETQKKGFAICVNSKVEKATMTKEEFRQATFDIHSYLPVLAGQAKLKGFTVKYPGQKAIIVVGNKLNDQAIRGLMELKTGDEIVVYDAKSESYFKTDVRTPMIITLR